MAMYYCDLCGDLFDDDEYPCGQHPTDPAAFCCEGCEQDHQENERIEAARVLYEDKLEEQAEFAARGLEA